MILFTKRKLFLTLTLLCLDQTVSIDNNALYERIMTLDDSEFTTLFMPIEINVSHAKAVIQCAILLASYNYMEPSPYNAFSFDTSLKQCDLGKLNHTAIYFRPLSKARLNQEESGLYVDRVVYEEQTLLMIVHGDWDSAYTGINTVFVDMSGQNRTCVSASDDYPFYAKGAVGAYLGGVALACSGLNPIPDKNSCYTYDVTTKTWLAAGQLQEKANLGTAIPYNATHIWIIASSRDSINRKTELYSVETEQAMYHTDLPIDKRYHTRLVRVDPTHIMMISHENLGAADDAWMYDMTTEEWTQLETRNEIKNDYPQFGMVRFPNGTNIVIVSGGYNSKKAESFDLETKTWSENIPDLPYFQHLSNAATVPFGNTFLIVGGNQGNVRGNEIIKYDIDTEDWVVMDEKLPAGVYHPTAYFVPENYATCN